MEMEIDGTYGRTSVYSALTCSRGRGDADHFRTNSRYWRSPTLNTPNCFKRLVVEALSSLHADMASSADEVPPTKDEDVPMSEPSRVSSPKELRNALYAKCASFEEGHIFYQDDIFAFGIIPDNSVEQLQAYTKQLTKDGLFKLMSKDGKACWRVVKRADAAK